MSGRSVSCCSRCSPGQRLFTGETVSNVLGAVLQVEPKWDALPTATPKVLRKLLRRCLEKERKRRLRDIGDALTELDEALVADPQPQTDEKPPVSVPQLSGWRQGVPLAIARTDRGQPSHRRSGVEPHAA